MKFLCKMGIHKWEKGLSGSLLNPLAWRCSRCGLIRHFILGVGYIYGTQSNQQMNSDPK